MATLSRKHCVRWRMDAAWLEASARLKSLHNMLYKLRLAPLSGPDMTIKLLRLVEDIAAEEREEQRIVGMIRAVEESYRRDKIAGRLKKTQLLRTPPAAKLPSLYDNLLVQWAILSLAPYAVPSTRD